MRITGGILKGRRVEVPASGVRPATDRVREAVFSMLAPLCPDAVVLDLYAGSGAYGLEAWSRGAARVTWVEQAGPVYRCLEGNVRTLCAEAPPRSVRCLRASVAAFLAEAAPHAYTLVFADPPYDLQRGNRGLPVEGLASMVQANGVLLLEQAADSEPDPVPGFSLVRDRRYGRSRICLYRADRTE